MSQHTDTSETTASPYEAQASQFLTTFGLRLRITLSNSKPAPWGDEDRKLGERNHYRVTLSRAERIGTKPPRLTFDFFGSIADASAGKSPTAYGVLACISSDTSCPETFADFCGEYYGYEFDSIKALQTFKRASTFAKRLRAFLTPTEIEALSEIR